MVKSVIAVCFVLVLALPALAQDEYPRIQNSMGYTNLSFPNLDTGATSHRSGFANMTGFNLTRTYGLENYMGIYTLGSGVTLIADTFGGKATFRGAKVSPYATAGVGVGYFSINTSYGYGSKSSFATRYGVGTDIPINDTMAWKVEFTRMSFHVNFQSATGGGWTTGNNITTGVVFTLAQ